MDARSFEVVRWEFENRATRGAANARAANGGGGEFGGEGRCAAGHALGGAVEIEVGVVGIVIDVGVDVCGSASCSCWRGGAASAVLLLVLLFEVLVGAGCGCGVVVLVMAVPPASCSGSSAFVDDGGCFGGGGWKPASPGSCPAAAHA